MAWEDLPSGTKRDPHRGAGMREVLFLSDESWKGRCDSPPSPSISAADTPQDRVARSAGGSNSLFFFFIGSDRPGATNPALPSALPGGPQDADSGSLRSSITSLSACDQLFLNLYIFPLPSLERCLITMLFRSRTTPWR